MASLIHARRSIDSSNKAATIPVSLDKLVTIFTTICVFLFVLLPLKANGTSSCSSSSDHGDDNLQLVYGVDVSYPMHHHSLSSDNFMWLASNSSQSYNTNAVDEEENNQYCENKDNDKQQNSNQKQYPFGINKQDFYDNLIQGCIDYYGAEKEGKRCILNERDRIAMSLRQPQSMINYTQTGYAKIRAPTYVFQLLKEFWETNKDKMKIEKWPTGNTYTNHWEIPSMTLSIDDNTLIGGGHTLKKYVWNALYDIISEWTGQRLTEVSLYGIRIYKEGSILATHVDRLPLVSSAIINIDQDVDEPWPLEVIGHDGIAHNVTMEPGDLVLYESHSILHGRPFPLKGRFMANIFIHYEPVGAIEEQQRYQQPNDSVSLPQYIIPGSPEEMKWRKQNPDGHKPLPSLTKGQEKFLNKGITLAHIHVIEGNLEKLATILETHLQYLNAKDEMGFTPLHEAVRRTNEEIVHYLVLKGADINALTVEGKSVLWYAKYERRTPDGDSENRYHKHPIIDFLTSMGADEIGPAF